MNAAMLLRTKISIPPTRPGSVRRPRLTARINEGVKGPLTLLSAPAGFGKTQLLAEWAAQSLSPIAWLSLSFEDNDYVRFFRYLSKALYEVEPRLSDAVLDYLQTAESIRLEMATLLINEVSTIPKHFVLVVDEYHVLENSSIITDLNFLLNNLPLNLHLVIASRSEQALDLALLRARGQVTEIGADDLRLNREEIGLFFNQTMRLQLPIEAIQMLEERTEGWVTGLQLAALSLHNASEPRKVLQGFRGDARHMVDFLAQEVLSQQSIRCYVVWHLENQKITAGFIWMRGGLWLTFWFAVRWNSKIQVRTPLRFSTLRLYWRFAGRKPGKQQLQQQSLKLQQRQPKRKTVLRFSFRLVS